MCSVSLRDSAEAHFGGHPYTTRRAVNAWIRDGLAKESTAKGPKGTPFKVLTLTRSGAAAAERYRVARELGLPIDAQGRVLYPDAQIEYFDADGRNGRVNVEVASGHYRAPSVRAKAHAGFRLHANGAAGARVLRALGYSGDHGSIRGPAERDPAVIEL